jgi:hypothetical protein
MSEEELRDCFAMFALMRMSFNDAEIAYRNGAEKCYKIADAMMEARKPKEESGIVAVKRSSTKKEK